MRSTIRALAAASAIVVIAALGPAAASGLMPQESDTPDRSNRMQLVLDSSGSMKEPTGGGKSRIEAARSALRQVVDKLPEDQEVGMRVFGLNPDVAETDPAACKDSKLAVKVGTDNRDDLRSAIDDYKPAGWTPTGYALQQAAKDLGDSGSRSIVLVSDGESNCEPEPCKVAADLTKQGIDVRIDVVGLNVKGKAREQLQCIAKSGGGNYVDAKDAAGIVRGVTETVERASRPFDLTGEPIKGATTVDDAPTIATGQYLDKVPQTGRIYYRVKRTEPGSTVHVGVINENSAETTIAGLEVATLVRDSSDTTDGLADCGQASAWRSSVQGQTNPLGYASTSSWNSDPENACVTSEEVIVAIGSLEDSGASTGLPIEIGIYEEPPPADKSGRELDPAPPAPMWTPLEQLDVITGEVPGTSLVNAPVLDDGTYDLNINLGESQVIAVPLDWGQSVQAQVDAMVTDELRDSLATATQLQVDVISPLRADAGADFDGPESWSSLNWLSNSGESDFQTGAMSNTVGYLNRADSDSVGSSIPGLHYIRVSAGSGTTNKVANVPYTLTVKRNGTAGTGAPAYAQSDKLTPPEADSRLTEGPEISDTKTAKKQAAADEKSKSNSIPWLPIGLGAVGVAVLAAATGVLLRRLTRKQA